ncbi:MAG TPA: winged helix-turn-helix domain-containing protein [Pyrinomonadaceae bacterium]|nr:winged helix-turn-helix domain-containing protein [Pyrinomonadaceae bacterium]
MPGADNQTYEFGEFRLEKNESRLLRHGEPVALTPRAFAVLVALVERHGQLVTKDELMRSVWADSFVEEANLNVNISTLRKALGENDLIETVPKKGYRFTGVVSADRGTTAVLERFTRTSILSEEESFDADPRSTKRGVRPALVVGLAVALLVAISGIALFSVSRMTARGGAGEIKTLAVLPFKEIGEPHGDEYLGLGFADALITRLSNLDRVVIRPTSAVQQYSSKNVDAATVGRDLAVDSVLDGTIQQSGETLRVNVQLINVRDGAALWAGKFDEKAANIFALQDAISEHVAGLISKDLTSEEQRGLTKSFTTNAEAYKSYVKGRFILEKKTVDEAHLAIRYFEDAVARDPNYALAYTGLADAYFTIADQDDKMSYGETMAKCRAAAAKSLELDDTLAESHLSIALVRFYYDWDWTGAEREFTRAIELNPNYTPAHHEFSHFLMAMGRTDDSLRESKTALELEPLSVKMNVHLAWHYLRARQYDEAIAQGRKTLEMSPNYIRAHHFIGLALYGQQKYTEAINELEITYSLRGEGMEGVSSLGHVYAAAGRINDANRILEELKKKSATGYVSPSDMAIIYAGFGDKDQTLAWLEKAYQERNGEIPMLNVPSFFESLRDDPRFSDLLRRAGLNR